MKMMYSDSAMQKDKSDRPTTIRQVFADHESGALRVPCLRLQCVAFNTAFHEELIQANRVYLEETAKRSNSGGGRWKRQRVAAADDSSSDSSEDDTALALLAGARARNITKSRRLTRRASSSSLSSLSSE